MIIYNKLDNYFVVSADRQTFLGFEMIANLRDTSPLREHCCQILCAIETVTPVNNGMLYQILVKHLRMSHSLVLLA